MPSISRKTVMLPRKPNNYFCEEMNLGSEATERNSNHQNARKTSYVRDRENSLPRRSLQLGGPERTQLNNEVVFSLFGNEVELMRQVQYEKLDPKKIMQALIGVKEGIVREFLRYRKAQKIPIFKL